MVPFRDFFNLEPILVDDNTFTVSASQQKRNVNLREKLPEYIRQLPGHVLGLLILEDADMTYTTAPDQIGVMKLLNNLVVRGDGGRVMFNLGGADLRALEAYENAGKLISPDPDLSGGSTNNLYAYRVLWFAPPGFRKSDFAVPNKLFDAGALELTCGVLTDYSADTTAGTVRFRVYALCAGLPEIRIAPKIERTFWPGSGNQLELGDRAMLLHLLLCNSSSHDAITAGDFDSFSLSDRKGPVWSGVPAEVLTAMFWAQNAAGQITPIMGEPQAATDDNPKLVNGASPTALAATGALYQPLIWGPGRITKADVEGPFKLRWSGSQATAHALTTRILPRGQDEARDMAVRVARSMKLNLKGGRVKTETRKTYQGPHIEYMPWAWNF